MQEIRHVLLLYYKSRLDRMDLHKRPDLSSGFCRAAMLELKICKWGKRSGWTWPSARTELVHKHVCYILNLLASIVSVRYQPTSHTLETPLLL
jgi:hypothetical protein